MPQDRVDLEKRLQVAKATDVVKGSLFNGVCAELGRLAPDHPRVKEIRAQHQKAFWMEFTDHPVADYLKLVVDAAEAVEPRFGGATPALQAIGAAGGRAFLSSVVGRLAVRMVVNKAPIDILSYAPAVYGPSASYGKRWFTRVSDREGIFHCRQEFLPPAYHVGLLPEGVQTNGHKVTVEAKVLDLLDADYVVRWDGQPPVKAMQQ
jgi:uncharacterized protein (TIGR02265 family)